MLFNSLRFLIFFPIVVSVYFLLPYRFRWIWLLAASYYFYMCWRWQYTALLVVATLVDYWAGLQMGKTADRGKRLKYLLMSIGSNLGLLFFFKYVDFFDTSINSGFSLLGWHAGFPLLHLILPVGISFHTFQGLAYSIDVYRGKREPERHLGIFALYIAFFPQMVAGPIERPGQLIPQFYRRFDFDYRRVTHGLKLMAWGFFKKLVIADALAPVVDSVYKSPRGHTPFDLILASYYFTFQIYCDFAGYTDIARGAAQVMGIHLAYNFNRPYFSKSIVEFWKRWHMSLSTWFRDYLYIPLGGNQVSPWRWSYNILMVFLLSGLWHGANWTYVVWGGLHGFFYLISVKTYHWRERFSRAIKLDGFPEWHKALRVFITFHLVVFTWIFFRARSIGDAFYITGAVSRGVLFLGTHASQLRLVSRTLGRHGLTPDEHVALAAILLMELLHVWQRSGSIREKLLENSVVVRWSCYAALVLSILVCGELEVRQFIYFQF